MKKLSAIILTAIMLLSATTVSALPIYSQKEVIPISKSITLTKVKDFYSDHNISYSYIKADLTDENISVNLLKSDKGSDILDTVSNLAKTDADTVAAMNADFFSVHSGSKGFSLGIEIQNGNMLQSPIYPETMATISSLNNTLSMGYPGFIMAAVAPNGNYEVIRHFNKHTTYYGDILMYTSDWNGGYSPAPGGVVVEVVVSGGKITEMRRNMPAVKIPEDGCVLVVSEGSSMFFANNFRIGDEIKFDYYIDESIKNADAAFGGGAMLLSGGQVVSSFSHVISGYNPRSAVGMSKDGKTLYMVAVDGRQSSSRGMTMWELAELMKELGCYNAVNLDGGGSTNMVASTLYSPALSSANSPTENRKVINAVGLGYEKSSGAPYGIDVKIDKTKVFIGDNVNITPYVYDENMRPASGQVILSSSNGTVSNNVFTPKAGGKATIEARSGSAYGSAYVYVVDKIVGIDTVSHIYLNKGETKSFDIAVFDNEGNYVTAYNTGAFNITSSNPGVVSVNGNKVTGIEDGTAYITIEKDGAKSYISIAVGGTSYNYTETFEYEEGYFSSYPTTVKGEFGLTEYMPYGGSKSGYLSYDFTEESDTTKAVYYNLNSKKTINPASDTVTIYAKSENDFNHDLRAQFTDANGKTVRAIFADYMPGGKWQRFICRIPDDAARPVTLDKIYAVYVAGEEQDSGTIYIDNLSYDMTQARDFASAPQNIYTDIYTGNSSKGIFRVGALLKNPRTLLSGLINSDTSTVVSMSGSNALIGSLKPFSTREDANSLYISINTSEGSIQKTDSKQWNNIANAIYSTKKDNVFILSDNSIFGSNTFENQAILGYFSELHKNIFIISGGDANTYKNIDGVRYFTIANTEKEELSDQRLKNIKYLEFYFGDSVTFAWKSVY